MTDLPIMLSRCPISTIDTIDRERPVPIVPKSHDCVLSDKQLVDYRTAAWTSCHGC